MRGSSSRPEPELTPACKALMHNAPERPGSKRPASLSAVVAVMLVALAGCDGGSNPSASDEPTTAESASIKAIFDGITRTSRESFEREDWSSFAALYPAGTFACWNGTGEDHRYGFLSIRPVPD